MARAALSALEADACNETEFSQAVTVRVRGMLTALSLVYNTISSSMSVSANSLIWDRS